jgi:hypothetical protein
LGKTTKFVRGKNKISGVGGGGLQEASQLRKGSTERGQWDLQLISAAA